MRERVCRNCGGRQYKVVGQNMVKCQFCGTLYVDEQASKEEEILTVSAYEKLRACKFEEAATEFDKILALYPMSFEAHFGKTQAKNKIVIYNNKRWERKVPRFFGDTIASITEDEDFIAATKNAPEDTLANYNEISKRVEKVLKGYSQLDKQQPFDVVVCAMEYHKDNPDDKIVGFVEKLKQNGIKPYFVQGLEGKEKEEESFFALSTAKAFLLFANSNKGYADPTYKHLFDRYLYFINQKKKYSKSFIVVLDEDIVKKEEIPAELLISKNFVSMHESDFDEILMENVQEQIKKTAKESAKIETVKVEKVDPQKKEYIDIENINPIDLGYYEVENLESDGANKIRWIFLSLKNADFVNARRTIDAELEKDPNNAELLFADVLCEQQLKTAGEFFAGISNFSNKEKIDKILTYATKEFAEMFVDNWEKLIVSLDSEEYYNAFLLYLAKFNTPYRDQFISAAENKAVETQDEDLIDKVTKCFQKEDVDRFINFYFMLAQQSDNSEYYNKVLEIDAGHEQSNLALLLKKFKNEDVLTYRNREEIEDVFKFLSENARAQYISAVTNLILPLSFVDLEKAEKQLDFYLSYVTDAEKLVANLRNVADKFAEMGFYKQAEKYISIAISKDKENAQLYWNLLKIKAHCKSDMEVITSSVDFTQTPEWETILKFASEEQTEKYAEIVSRSHLTNAEKKAFKEDRLDKVTLKEKLSDFLNRNSAILLERTKEDDLAAIKGVNYYKVQLVPIINYFESLDGCATFEDYASLYDRLFERLRLLDLTLESSISAISIMEKGDGLKNVQTEHDNVKVVSQRLKLYKEKTDHKKFWKVFSFAFFECVPVCFALLLLSVIVIDPKLVYMYFPQIVVIGLVIYSAIVAVGNLILYCVRKKKLQTKWKVWIVLVMIFSFATIVLMSIDFYFTTKSIEITSAKEFDILLHNAPYSNFKLVTDIDMEGKEFTPVNFSGTLDGDGFAVTNVVFAGKGNYALFNGNSGIIKKLTIVLQDHTYNNVNKFAIIANVNKGTIANCHISGSIELNLVDGAIVGGLVAISNGGNLTGNETYLNLVVKNATNASLGGLAGRIDDKTTLYQNDAHFNVNLQESANTIYLGGLAGIVQNIENEGNSISQNKAGVHFVSSVNVSNSMIGGLIGKGLCGSHDNYATGDVTLYGAGTKTYVGGLYGWYQNANTGEEINHSYSTVEITEKENLTIGSLAGYAYGTMKNSYSNRNNELKGSGAGVTTNCDKNISGYEMRFGFDRDKVWSINNLSSYPKFKWE